MEKVLRISTPSGPAARGSPVGTQRLHRGRTLTKSVWLILGAWLALGAASRADWPQFRGDPAHTGMASDALGSLIVPLWTQKLPTITVGGIPYDPDVTGSPAIAGSTVYVGSGNTHLYALDAGTGAIRWEYPAAGPIRSSPLVDSGRVTFVSTNGDLTAVSTADGAKLWSMNSGGMQDQASPALAGGAIIAGATFPQRRIYAVPAAGGPEAWHVSTGQPVFSSAAVDTANQRIYCGANDGKLYALHFDGTPAWGAPIQTDGGIFMASPSVVNGRVYLSAGDYDLALHAWDAATGSAVWSSAMTPTPTLPPGVSVAGVSSPAVDGSFLAVVGGWGNEWGPSLLFAFRDDGTSATPLWSVALPNRVSESYVSSPALTRMSVIIGVAAAADASHPTWPRGRVYVVDRATGTARWYAAGDPGNGVSGGPILSSPAVAGDLVVVGDSSGLVTAYRLRVAGDADGNGSVDVADAVLLARVAGGLDPSAPVMLAVGDLSPTDTQRADGSRSFGDGAITSVDVARVLSHAAGLDVGTWP